MFGTPWPKVKPKPIGQELKDRGVYILPPQGVIRVYIKGKSLWMISRYDGNNYTHIIRYVEYLGGISRVNL